MSTSVRVLLVLVAAVVGAVVYYMASAESITGFGGIGAPQGEGLPFGMWVLGYLVTVAGVFLGSGFRAVLRAQGQGKDDLELRLLLGQVLRSTDLWLGLLGSPMAFALILRALDGLGTSGLVAVALQNGFFCSSIVSELLSSRSGRASKDSAGAK